MSGTTLPLIITSAGPAPTPPATLLSTLLSNVAALVPGYTANLPASMIEDMSSTAVGILALLDQARVEQVNDVSPLAANAFVLALLGQQFGIPQGVSANASVDVVFSGSVGYVIPPGFLISDGTNQYAVQDGAIIATGGSSPQVTAVATSFGTWAIPAGSVDQVITSVPSEYTVTVTNPQAGTPATNAESVEAYRARVFAASVVGATGVPAYLQTLLTAIVGVTSNLVSINSISGGGWQIIAGGGDAYEIANAILQGVPDIATLQGSQLAITGISAATNAVITTETFSSVAVGAQLTVTGATPSAYNTTYTVTAVSGTEITTSINSSAFGVYSAGAIFNPSPRNVTVSVFQNPNTYNILFVNPPQQVVTIAVVWNTQFPNFTGGLVVSQLAAPAIQSYINNLFVGQPINELEMTAVFQEAVASVISAPNITTLEWTVTINGVAVSPSAGTSIVEGDPESYFSASATAITVVQG